MKFSFLGFEFDTSDYTFETDEHGRPRITEYKGRAYQDYTSYSDEDPEEFPPMKGWELPEVPEDD